LEIHGDNAALFLDSWFYFDSPVCRVARGGTPEPIPVPARAQHDVDYSRGLAELAAVVRAGRPDRASGKHAAHVVEIVEAITTSVRSGEPVRITSSFTPTGAPVA
jgi:predicted dehydrogenase